MPHAHAHTPQRHRQRSISTCRRPECDTQGVLGESSARVAPPIGGAGEQAGSHTERQNVALRANQCSTFSLAPLSLPLSPYFSRSHTPDRKGTKSSDGCIAARRHTRQRLDVRSQRRVFLTHRNLCHAVVCVLCMCVCVCARGRALACAQNVGP